MSFIFADTMADNGRLSRLTDVINLYLELMSAHRGEVICKVTTAKVSTCIFNQYILESWTTILNYEWISIENFLLK